MMEVQVDILVVGTHEKILATILRLLNAKAEWTASGAISAAEVLQKCREKEYHVLLLGAGLTDQAERQLSDNLRLNYPGIHIIPHYGGGSGLLFAEIYRVLQK